MRNLNRLLQLERKFPRHPDASVIVYLLNDKRTQYEQAFSISITNKGLDMKPFIKRLQVLEDVESDKPYKTVYWSRGRYYVCDDIDYRSAIGGDGSHTLTEDEFNQLEKTYDIILVRYVDGEINKPGTWSS